MTRSDTAWTVGSSRVEAFSDGVFAIAITLLILEIKVPEVEQGHHLWSALGGQWPSYAAYVVSFLVIGIMWLNHHTLFGYVARVDRGLMILNLLLLLVVAAIPWPTALMAAYLREDKASHDAAIVYSGTMVLIAIAYTTLWWWATRPERQLLHAELDQERAQATVRRFALGLVVYPLTVVLALVSAPLTLAVHGALAVYYAFNQVAVPRRSVPDI
jgi:uncharacterized membrane protein